MKNNIKIECWVELFKMWLRFIGATDINPVNSEYGRFSYSNRPSRYIVFRDPLLAIDIGHDFGYGEGWSNIDLPIEYVDIQDPSFNPDTFFKPFKKWLDENA